MAKGRDSIHALTREAVVALACQLLSLGSVLCRCWPHTVVFVLADAGDEVEWEQEDMSIDEEEVPPSHNLQDMPWDDRYGELSRWLLHSGLLKCWNIGSLGIWQLTEKHVVQRCAADAATCN